MIYLDVQVNDAHFNKVMVINQTIFFSKYSPRYHSYVRINLNGKYESCETEVNL